MRSFDFEVEEIFDIPKFVQKTELRAIALKVASSKVDVERDRGKEAKTDVVACSVMEEFFNPSIDQGRQYIRSVAREKLKQPSFKSDLVIGMACFDYKIMFSLRKTQAIDCYRHNFQSFSSRGWLGVSSVLCIWIIRWILSTMSDT